MSNETSPHVAVVDIPAARYPSESPFHPTEAYPEYPFPGFISKGNNLVYAGVRELFKTLGLDRENFGSPEWNPLGRLIVRGMTVVIKPNFVLSGHKERKDIFSVITHPSVLRVVADFCWIALRGSGRIIIADAPQYDCNWDQLSTKLHLDELSGFFSSWEGVSFDILDLRSYWSRGKHFNSMKIHLPGDPKGSMVFNLGRYSALFEIDNSRNFYGAVYHREEVIEHHSGERQEYELSRTVMEADVIISVPKLKVHKKVGVTLNAKGLVGINTNKNYLVHYILGSPSQGGDQYPDDLFSGLESFLILMERWMYDHFLASHNRFLEYLHRSLYWLHNHSTKLLGIKVQEWKRLWDAGNWYGNDSAWRMAADLFKILHYVGSDGLLRKELQRRTFTIIDGVVGGEGKGPLIPDPVPSAILIASGNLLAADLVATRLMGFNPLLLKMFKWLLKEHEPGYGVSRLKDIVIHSPNPDYRNCLTDHRKRYCNFAPYPTWKGRIEIDSPEGEMGE
jgi:uncharacterized protein (DUF362 family)